jgi:hypothetical protein
MRVLAEPFSDSISHAFKECTSHFYHQRAKPFCT